MKAIEIWMKRWQGLEWNGGRSTSDTPSAIHVEYYSSKLNSKIKQPGNVKEILGYFSLEFLVVAGKIEVNLLIFEDLQEDMNEYLLSHLVILCSKRAAISTGSCWCWN